MHDELVQSLRYKLQKRVRRLHSAGHAQFYFLLKSFFVWFESQPLLVGVRDTLLARAEELKPEEAIEIIFGPGDETFFGDTEVEQAAIGYLLLKRFARSEEDYKLQEVSWKYERHREYDEMLNTVRTVFLEPFYEYIDEHLDDRQAVLGVLRRYKHRCEWFRADELRQTAEEATRSGEGRLAADLYEYLHDQGIDFQFEVVSATGRADLVGAQIGNDRLVADAKLLWPQKGKDKKYLLAGFHQAYTYACEFNEPVAYLVIYKLCPEVLRLELSNPTGQFPSMVLNNKTVFFVVIDVCDQPPPSKRGGVKTIDITEADLIRAAEKPAA